MSPEWQRPGEEIHDNTTDWIAAHIREYLDSGGERGHRWRGVDTLLLTTRGRRTGRLRRTPLIYGRDDERYVVVASLGGAPRHPYWYLNMLAEPEVRIQVGGDQIRGIARTATDLERLRLWPMMAEIWPNYTEYQERTTRRIPVVVIESA